MTYAGVIDVVGSVPALNSKFYEQVLETAPDGMVVVDRNGIINFVSRQGERMFGWRRDQLLGQAVEVLVPGRVRDQHPHHRRGYFALPNTRPMAANLPARGHCGPRWSASGVSVSSSRRWGTSSRAA